VSDLSPLQGMQLEVLGVQATRVDRLEPLRGLPLTYLNLNETGVTDLSSLARMPLRSLLIAYTAVRDLSPLRGMPLENLYFDNSQVTDVSPLATMDSLRTVMVPVSATNLHILRGLPGLERISFQWDPNEARPTMTAKEFWSLLESQQLTSDLAQERRFSELSELLKDRTVQYPTNPEYWVRLGSVMAQSGKWDEACEAFSHATKLAPEDHIHTYNLAVALLRGGKEDQYRLCCRRFLDSAQESRSDYVLLIRAASVSLVLPVDGADFRRACGLADLAAKLNQPENMDHWGHSVWALAEYRRERHQSAKTWADRAVDQTPPGEASCAAAAWFIKASACTALGEFKAAQTALAKGDAVLDQPRDVMVSLEWQWRDWAIAEHLREEAAALLEAQLHARKAE